MGGLQSAHASVIGDALQAGFQGFVDQSTLISVPYTAIVGRAKIPNLANDLRASLGIERIMTQSIMQLQNEFGASGEPVFAAVNDDRGLIRFVGNWRTVVGDVDGTRAFGGSIEAYVEVTFYGTGLNWLGGCALGTKDVRLTIDGGTEGGSSIRPVVSDILSARYYSGNNIYPVCSGLTLGIHTIKLRLANASNIDAFGFEILNADVSGHVNINPGTGYLNGQKYTNALADSVDYNLGISGIRGGRFVRYLNADGTVGQAFQAVNASPAYLASADHTNEEVVRTYHWREFGAGRPTSDDFSSLVGTSSNRAFTLDDGSTTLVGSGVMVYGTEGVTLVNNGSSFLTITFIGTGLDLILLDSASGGNDSYQYSVDGSALTAWANTAGNTSKRVQKVVSGLPYGTHTFKLYRNSATTWAPCVLQFIVYQPKKPIIPTTALELCDYNVMADFVAGTEGVTTIATGVLRKVESREMVYVGTWSSIGVANIDTNITGVYVSGTTNGTYAQYTFFGTGIELRFKTYSTPGNTLTVTVDGSSNLSSFTTGYFGTRITSFTAATGVLLTAGGAGFSSGMGAYVKNMPLGLHTVRLTLTTDGGNGLFAPTIDIITPIHSYKSNLYADLQNTLPVGSCSLTDSRTLTPIKGILPATKAWAQAIGVGGTITSSVTSYIPVSGLSLTVKTSGGPLQIIAVMDLYVATSGHRGAIAIYVDGVMVSTPAAPQAFSTAGEGHMAPCITTIAAVSAGVHKVDVYWIASSGSTIYSYIDSTFNGRVLTVQEL